MSLTASPPDQAETTAVMPNFGFVIDNRKCIGCHACSVACKSENEVPLGAYRTWVKYVETGAYPNARRHFQVTRCNHCANPPCTRICPTEAMYQRADGIVEFDPRVCIGCKACMQACPYDAIYIDPETNTAAKCHYCAHRTDIGLEPACVVVCPEQAIIAGDLNDPQSQISQLVAQEDVTVRKPEQGTAPKLFYIEGHDVVMHPTATERTPESFMWADVIPLHDIPIVNGNVNNQANGHNGHHKPVAKSPTSDRQHSNGTPLRQAQPQGQPWRGPIQIADGRMAEQMVQVAYNAQHKVPWHWPVPAYLVTKAIGAGLMMILGLGWLLGGWPIASSTAVAAGFIALLAVGLTTALLVYDLEKPERFLYILARPQWRSWLTRGAVILIAFSTVTGIWWLIELAGWIGWLGTEAVSTWRTVLLTPNIVLAGLTAVYTAFLFAQAEGRDLWQSPLLPPHLLIQATMAGSGVLLGLGLFFPLPETVITTLGYSFVALLLLDLLVTLGGEFAMPHASEVAGRAAHDISHGRYRNHFWGGAIILGHALPLLILIGGLSHISLTAGFGLIAAVCTLIGLYLYEYAFVMAPQEIPNS